MPTPEERAYLVAKLIKDNFPNSGEKFTTDAGRAALMGNIDVETGGSFDSTQKQDGGGPGYGLFQMEGVLKAGYTKFCRGDDSTEKQVQFVKQEIDTGTLIGPGNAARIRSAFQRDNLANATDLFCTLFERPRDTSETHLKIRRAKAEKWLKKVKEWGL